MCGKIEKGLFERYPMLLPQKEILERACGFLVESYQSGGIVLTCGNGGSAADSEHIVGELMKGFLQRRPLNQKQREAIAAVSLCDSPERFAAGLQQGIPAISLVSQTALLTAFSNDVDPDMVFAQQVFAYGREKDVLIALSTSGNSKNVVNAAIAAKAKKMRVVSFTGAGGGKLSKISDAPFRAPAEETFLIQEFHLPLYHALCAMTEKKLFSDL